MKRRFGHGELHLALLALLATRPMHGYELMNELGSRMRRYKPSPGSIYPAISALEADGLIAAGPAGERKTYEITPAGTSALARRADELARIETEHNVRFGEDSVDVALARFAQRVRGLTTTVDELAPVLDEALTKLTKETSHD